MLSLDNIDAPQRPIGLRNLQTVNQILHGFKNNQAMPPIEVSTRNVPGSYQYKVKNGFHRYWLSHLVGYTKIPAVVNNFELSDLDPA